MYSTELFLIEKVKDKQGRVIGCKARDNKGMLYAIPRSALKRYRFSNATITKDFKIMLKDTAITLYHGSHNGIQGTILADKSRVCCDFGQAFYTGNNEEQAKMLLVSDDNGQFYILHIDLTGLRVYEFTDAIEWALYVGVKRGYIDVTKYRRLQAFVQAVDTYDVIVGDIADDRMTIVYPDFIAGNLTDKALVAALKHIKYGKQYAFKTNKACAQLRVVHSVSLTKEERVALQHKKNVLIGGLDDVVKQIRQKYRRTGKYIDEILANWR